LKYLMQKACAVFDRIVNYFAFFAGAILIFIWLAVCTDVILRYFMNRPLNWVTDIAAFSLSAITFLGAAWLLKREGHISLDVVLNLLSPKALAAFNTMTSILSTITCLVIAFYGAEAAWDYYQRGVMTMTVPYYPAGPVLAILPVGFFIFFIQFARRSYRYLQVWIATVPEKKEERRIDMVSES